MGVNGRNKSEQTAIKDREIDSTFFVLINKHNKSTNYNFYRRKMLIIFFAVVSTQFTARLCY